MIVNLICSYVLLDSLKCGWIDQLQIQRLFHRVYMGFHKLFIGRFSWHTMHYSKFHGIFMDFIIHGIFMDYTFMDISITPCMNTSKKF